MGHEPDKKIPLNYRIRHPKTFAFIGLPAGSANPASPPSLSQAGTTRSQIDGISLALEFAMIPVAAAIVAWILIHATHRDVLNESGCVSLKIRVATSKHGYELNLGGWI